MEGVKRFLIDVYTQVVVDSDGSFGGDLFATKAAGLERYHTLTPSLTLATVCAYQLTIDFD